MKFLNLFNKSSSAAGFAKIIVRRALDSDENYNLLFVGAPASSKTLFLQSIIEMKSGVYFDGSNTTNRILDVLEEKRPKIIFPVPAGAKIPSIEGFRSSLLSNARR
jgi:hypothetical protein